MINIFHDFFLVSTLVSKPVLTFQSAGAFNRRWPIIW